MMQAIRRNGENIATDNTGATITGTASQFNVGSDGTSFHDGKIAEMVVYTGPIDPSGRGTCRGARGGADGPAPRAGRSRRPWPRR